MMVQNFTKKVRFFTMQLRRISNYRDFKGQIIWSADNISHADLVKIVSNPDFPNGEVAIKLDRVITESEEFGYLNCIKEFQEEYGVAVFDDGKIVEIPNKVMSSAERRLKSYHPWMCNVMAGVISNMYCPGCSAEQREAIEAKQEGREPKPIEYDALYRFAQLCAEYDTLSCAVSVLTSKSEATVKYEFGDEPLNVVRRYAQLAAKFGITDFVCSPKEIEVVAPLGLTLNTPGIRKVGDNADDQARIDTPYGAIKRAVLATGSTEGGIRLVIGRSIWQPGQPYEMVNENIEKTLVDIYKAKGDLMAAQYDKPADKIVST